MTGSPKTFQTLRWVAGVSLLGAVSLHAQTLNWSSLTNSTIADRGGDPLNNAYVFQLGTFADNFIPNASNVPSWLANWRVFDTAQYSNNPTDLGFFTGTENIQDVPQYSSLFEGLQAYVFIYDPENTQYFLATTDAWVFPTLEQGCCPNGEPITWSISDLGSDNPIWGGQDGNQGGGEYENPGPFDIQTHAVPEPSSTVLALAALTLATWRRRRTC